MEDEAGIYIDVFYSLVAVEVAKYLPERLILPGASAKNSENNSHVQC